MHHQRQLAIPANQVQAWFTPDIDLISNELPNFGPDTQFNAYSEMFFSAKEAGFKEEALLYARRLLELMPGLPSAVSYLSQHGNTT